MSHKWLSCIPVAEFNLVYDCSKNQGLALFILLYVGFFRWLVALQLVKILSLFSAARPWVGVV